MAEGEWYQVTGPHFVCGVAVKKGDVVETAPVLAWVLMRRDRSFEWLKSYAAARGWEVSRLVVTDQGVHREPVIQGRTGQRELFAAR